MRQTVAVIELTHFPDSKSETWRGTVIPKILSCNKLQSNTESKFWETDLTICSGTEATNSSLKTYFPDSYCKRKIRVTTLKIRTIH